MFSFAAVEVALPLVQPLLQVRKLQSGKEEIFFFHCLLFFDFRM